VCILVGGLGTRLGDLVTDIPKPLLEVAGEPFILHQLRSLSQQGIERVVLCVGHLGDLVERTVGEHRFGIEISYSHDGSSPAGTLGALRRALPLTGERFLVLYGDTYLQVDYAAMVKTWGRSGLPAVMTVLRNEDRWDTSNVLYEGGLVTRHDKASPAPEMRWIDYGLGGLEAEAISVVDQRENDLAALYAELARQRLLAGFEVTERFHEIGTPEALAETEAYLRSLGGGERE
jgi:N-acetyl-alpha-D-muramate 1-phosphate uridylyltransferase